MCSCMISDSINVLIERLAKKIKLEAVSDYHYHNIGMPCSQ